MRLKAEKDELNFLFSSIFKKCHFSKKLDVVSKIKSQTGYTFIVFKFTKLKENKIPVSKTTPNSPQTTHKVFHELQAPAQTSVHNY